MESRTRFSALKIRPGWVRSRLQSSSAGSRSLRLAQALSRVAALEDRIKYLEDKYDFGSRYIKPLLEFDPSHGRPDEGKYLEWLVRNFQEYSGTDFFKYGRQETLESIGSALKKFDQWKKGGKLGKQLLQNAKGPDIFRYSFEDLIALKNQSLKSEINYIYNKNGIQIYQLGGQGKDPDDVIDLACMIGIEGKWCTKDRYTARKYLGRGNLYAILRDGKPVAQLLDSPNQYDVQFQGAGNTHLDPSRDWDLFQAILDSGLAVDRILELATNGGMYFPEVVLPYIEKNPVWAVRYAIENKQTLPGSEPYILQDIPSAFRYAKLVKKGRWPELEQKIKEEFQEKFPNLPPLVIEASIKYWTELVPKDSWDELFDIVRQKVPEDQGLTHQQASRRSTRIAYQLMS